MKNLHIPLAVLKVSVKRPSVFTLHARKNKKEASFVPHVNTAADEKVVLAQADESKVGTAASANAPVPRKSTCRR